MPIAVVCPQGHKLTAKDQLAGKRVKCPKCGAAVLVPELPVPELGDEVVMLEAVPQRVVPQPAIPARRPSEPAYVPPGGDTPGDAGYALQPLAAPPSTQSARSAAIAPVSPTTKPAFAAASKPPSAKPVNVALIAALAGGGALAAISVLAVVGWLLLARGGDDQAIVANQTPPPQPPVAAAPPALPSQPTGEPKSAPAPAAAPPPVLTRIELDERLDGYKLAGTTWASAYDETSGRLAVTHDEHGIVIYDVDEITRGVLSPVATLATDGLPTAVCIKPLGERRMLVVAGKDQPQVTIYDLENPTAPEKISMGERVFVDFLTGSANPTDPLVYYSTQRSQQREHTTEERLGRIDLARKELAGIAQQDFADVTLSPDGERLYARPNNTGNGILGTWAQIANFRGDASRSGYPHWDRRYSPSPVCLLDQAVAVNFAVYSSSMSVFAARPSFAPAAAFQGRPVLIGLSKNELVFGSANDYRPLASIPLPSDWLRDDRHVVRQDFRLRHELAPTLKSAYLDIRADHRRGLGLVVTGEHLVIAPLAKARMRHEPSLIVRQTLPAPVTAGQPVVLKLQTEAPSPVFEFVPNADGLHSSNEGRLRLLGAASPASQALQVFLAAAVNSQQNLVFVRNIELFANAKLPLQIQIGDEVMAVTSIDDFKEALVVERTSPVAHSVTSKITLPADPAAAPSLPSVIAGTFRWTPSSDQVGRHTIRMRARSGKLVHEWFWDVEVQREAMEFPFYVQGIEPEPGTSRAVIWGRATAPWIAAPGAKPNASYLGVYDLAERRLLHHAQVEKPISAAAMHASGIYAALVSLDTEVKASRQAENAREAANRQVTPTKIVRYDPQTLRAAEVAEIPEHCGRLLVIGGRYLAGFDRWSGATFRLAIPALAPATPVANYPYPIAGRIKDGWVWDGVVWDDAFREPRLLLFPVHFETRQNDAPEMIAAAGGTIAMRPAGPYVCTWFPSGAVENHRHSLHDHPGALSCTEGRVDLFSSADTSRVRLGATRPPDASVKLIDIDLHRPPRGPAIDDRQFAQMFAGHVTESGGEVYVALQGKLHSFPLERLVREETPFRFVERQERIVLEAGQTARLSYSAPGATKYEFQLWYQRPHFADDQPAFTAQSADGTFELPLDNISELAGKALAVVGIGAQDRGPQATLDRVTAYMKRIEPTFHQLTGRLPAGVPFPVYVSVIAEHPDGRQKAGLAHSYLIEVPLQEFQKEPADR